MPKGTLVIRAAEQIGVQIPRFCDHPLLDPVGACRQCLVEVEGQRKPQASCTMTVRRRHGRHDPAHLAGRRQGAAGRHGAPAHQPPARLPGLRQGRRVPAAEPGDVATAAARLALRGRQAHLPQADQHLRPGAARPRALRAVRPLHPLLRADRRRPVHRAARARRAAAGRHLRGRAVRVATSPATPSRSARSARSPAPPTASGPARSTWSPRPSVCEHCASRLRASAPTTGAARCCAAWPATTPRSTRSGTATRAASRSPTPPQRRPAHHAAGPRRRRRAAAGLLARGPRGRGRRTGRGRTAPPACSPAAGSPSRTPTPTRKFARVVLGTNDIDFRARPHSAEEADFLAAHVAGRGR